MASGIRVTDFGLGTEGVATSEGSVYLLAGGQPSFNSKTVYPSGKLDKGLSSSSEEPSESPIVVTVQHWAGPTTGKWLFVSEFS